MTHIFIIIIIITWLERFNATRIMYRILKEMQFIVAFVLEL